MELGGSALGRHALSSWRRFHHPLTAGLRWPSRWCTGGTQVTRRGVFMFLRMTKIEGTPEQIESPLAHYQEQVVPRVRNLPGFVGAGVHVDRLTGTRLGLSMWETEEALRGSEQVSQAVRTDMVPTTS